MKTLGIIGGLGPEATIEYYRTIIAVYREQKPDGSYPQFFINSVDLSKGVALISANDRAGLIKYLLEEIQKLAKAGADFGLIAANTPHIVFDDVEKQSLIPLLSIIRAAGAAAKERAEQSNFCFRRRPIIDYPASRSMERELLEHHGPAHR